ncbi:hypothetical protein DPMN_007788 [Dreissena polymorpha]|uniref:Uncharacterized protein n=1 Tax=Dreissena polymorpha TaxID=45954 RepID=A0A9D4MUY0_DREPO|nr:hypothetical protein DPMN_007788 [Dreissena polymorpha]
MCKGRSQLMPQPKCVKNALSECQKPTCVTDDLSERHKEIYFTDALSECQKPKCVTDAFSEFHSQNVLPTLSVNATAKMCHRRFQ